VKCGVLIFTAACGWLMTPPSARSQEADPQNSVTQGESQKQSKPAYAGYAVEETKQNEFIMDLTSGASYNDNVSANNLDRVDDTLFSIGGLFGVNERQSRYDMTLIYRPSFIAYRRFGRYDQLNHDVGFQGTYHATPHLDLNLQDATDYYRGIFETPVTEMPFSPTAPLPNLNQTVFTPLVNEFSNETRVDAIYRLTPHGAANVYAAFEDRTFGSLPTSEGLFNTVGGAAGLTYTYHLSRAWSVAPSYSYQKLTFGSSSQVSFHIASLNVTWNATPTLTIAAFGGAQYAELNESPAAEALVSRNSLQFLISATGPIYVRGWYPQYGASITKDIKHFQFELSGQHIETDGGGVLTSVVNTQQNLQLRWELTEHWEARVSVENSDTLALSSAYSNARVRSQSGGFALERRFTPRLSARLGYEYTRQRVGGTLPFFFNMDRNIASFSITYRIKDLLLGR
jgi:hypothetical protein